MPLIPIVIKAAADPRLSAHEIRTVVLFTCHSDDDGNVGSDETGRPLASAATIADTINIATSTAFKVLARLEACGYIRWEREQGVKLREAKAGKLRIVLSENAHA